MNEQHKNYEYRPSQNLEEENNLADTKLAELKNQKPQLLVADWDGTIYSKTEPLYDTPHAIGLINQAVQANTDVLILTARDATLLMALEEIKHQLLSECVLPLSFYRGGGNGSNLEKITLNANGDFDRDPIYRFDCRPEDCTAILHLLENAPAFSIDPKAQHFFLDQLSKNWKNIIPQEYLDVTSKFEGKIFFEPAKISLVLPTDAGEQIAIVQILRQNLEPLGLSVGWGNDSVANISRKLVSNGITIPDGKLFALQTLIQQRSFSIERVGVFGDCPQGNDGAMLTLPYSFTNFSDFHKNSPNAPPFVLNTSDISPIGSMYRAIQFLVS